MGYFCCAL